MVAAWASTIALRFGSNTETVTADGATNAPSRYSRSSIVCSTFLSRNSGSGSRPVMY